jgi:hypothetical protein
MSSRDSEVLISCDVMKREGGHLLFSNKGGYINYAGHGYVGSFFFELSLRPTGLVISPPGDLAALSEADRQVVIGELDAWLAELGLAPELPDVPEEDDGPLLCLWKDCRRRRLKGRYICRCHYDKQPGAAGWPRYVDTSPAESV